MSHVPVLDFINLIIELMIVTPPAKDNEKRVRDQNLLRALKKLNVDDKSFSSVQFLLLTSFILNNSLKFVHVTSEKQSREQKLIVTIISQKFLALMQFALKHENDVQHLEIFLNLFYYLLNSDCLIYHLKLILLNRFFTLNGHGKLSKLTCSNSSDKKPDRVQAFKSRVVLSEVLVVFMEFFGKSEAEDRCVMKKQAYDIIFNADFLNGMRASNPTQETMLAIAFINVINLLWKTQGFNQNKLLGQTAFTLASLHVQQIAIKPIFLKMLVKLLTVTFKPIVRDYQILKISSNFILNSAVETYTLDLHYLKWWKAMGKPNESQLDQMIVRYLTQEHCDDLDDLKPSDLEVFDQKLLLEKFLTPEIISETTQHSRIMKILCSYLSSHSQDIEKLSRVFRQLFFNESEKNFYETAMINIASVMNARILAIQNDKEKLKITTGLSYVLKSLLKTSTPHLKMVTVEMAKNLLRYEL